MAAAANRDVLVVGDINLDILVRPTRPIRLGTDVDARIGQRPGGAGANVAAGLSRCGVVTTLVGCVGDNDAGFVTGLLRAAGVQLALRPVSDARTGAVVAIIGPDGERSMASDRGANLALDVADIPDELLARHRHLHVSGYSLFDAGTRAAAMSAISRAKALGRSVSVDPASVGPLQAYGVANFRADITGIDLLLPNADEARALSGDSDVQEAARVLALDHLVVAVTCGPDGALWAQANGVRRQPAVANPGQVLDTTGAGDAFTAGLLAAWLAGQTPNRCLHAGQQTAAEAVARWGAQ